MTPYGARKYSRDLHGYDDCGICYEQPTRKVARSRARRGWQSEAWAEAARYRDDQHEAAAYAPCGLEGCEVCGGGPVDEYPCGVDRPPSAPAYPDPDLNEEGAQ